MRKKNLKIQVAALAVTGAIATTPFVARAEETSSTAVTGTEATATTTATAAGTTTVGTTTAAAATPAASTTTAAPASTAATVESTAATTAATTATSGTTATAPAASGAATTPAASTTTAAPASTATGTTTAATAASTAATTATSGTTATGTTATTATATPAAPVTVTEPAADPATTVPNNVENVVGDDKQGTDIHFSGEFKKYGMSLSAGNSIDATITPENAKDGKTLAELPGGFNSVSAFSDIKAEDMIMKGDLSIAKEGASSYDSTETDAHSVDKEGSYSLKADLDVSSVSKALTASEGIGKNIVPGLISWYLGYNDININDTYVNNLTTGFRTVVQMDNNLDGSFYLPKDLEDAKEHYELSSADGNPMIYRINYGNSSFSKDKVSIAMDLDLTKMTPLENQYTGDKVGLEYLYGAGNKIENFRHPSNEYKYNTSVFGNLRKLVNSSAQKIQLVMKGIKLNSASDNRVETETSSTTATENITEKTITTEGSFKGTLVGYMNADVGHGSFDGKVSYKWGAIQNDAGRDKVAGQDNDKVYLTVKFTDKERTVTPITPVNPVQPVNPVNPVTPSNGGNGGSRTPIVNPSTPSTPSQPGNVLGEDRPTPSNQGEVLGENRPAPTAVETVEKKGEVLGESRPSGKNVSARATVATGDNNFTALWASLFGLSAASLAGFVVLRKKEQEV